MSEFSFFLLRIHADKLGLFAQTSSFLLDDAPELRPVSRAAQRERTLRPTQNGWYSSQNHRRALAALPILFDGCEGWRRSVLAALLALQESVEDYDSIVQEALVAVFTQFKVMYVCASGIAKVARMGRARKDGTRYIHT